MRLDWHMGLLMHLSSLIIIQTTPTMIMMMINGEHRLTHTMDELGAPRPFFLFRFWARIRASLHTSHFNPFSLFLSHTWLINANDDDGKKTNLLFRMRHSLFLLLLVNSSSSSSVGRVWAAAAAVDGFTRIYVHWNPMRWWWWWWSCPLNREREKGKGWIFMKLNRIQLFNSSIFHPHTHRSSSSHDDDSLTKVRREK